MPYIDAFSVGVWSVKSIENIRVAASLLINHLSLSPFSFFIKHIHM